MLHASFFMETYHSNRFFPIQQQSLSGFISYLYSRKYAYSTIVSYISCISYFCKLWSFPDPANSFLTRKLLTGVKRSANRVDSRLPITPTILEQLILFLPFSFSDHYMCVLLQSMYLLAFHAFLRIGEMTPANATCISKVIQFRDVKIMHTPDSKTCLEVIIRHCKGNISREAFSITIEKSEFPLLCCVAAFREFVKIRGFKNGPLFLFQNGDPVLRHKFGSLLKTNLAKAGFDIQLYKGHSFRIGAATSAAAAGISEENIMKLGRWKSSAFKKYIRIPNLNIKSKVL